MTQLQLELIQGALDDLNSTCIGDGSVADMQEEVKTKLEKCIELEIERRKNQTK